MKVLIAEDDRVSSLLLEKLLGGLGHEVVTVEGHGFEHVQEAFVDAGAVQCGFCTPGLVVATAALLEQTPDPAEHEIREALSGNLCRCTGYTKIFDAVRLAARR